MAETEETTAAPAPGADAPTGDAAPAANGEAKEKGKRRNREERPPIEELYDLSKPIPKVRARLTAHTTSCCLSSRSYPPSYQFACRRPSVRSPEPYRLGIFTAEAFSCMCRTGLGLLSCLLARLVVRLLVDWPVIEINGGRLL